MTGKNENKNPEGVETPSVEMVAKTLLDDALAKIEELEIENSNLKVTIDTSDKVIKDVKEELKKSEDYGKSLEDQLSDYAIKLNSNDSEDEFSHIPLVNIIDGKKYTRSEVAADKKLVKLFKK